MIMGSPHPAAMYWGKDLTAIYNEAYVLVAGKKHPELMGQSYSRAWKEVWHLVKDSFDSAGMEKSENAQVGEASESAEDGSRSSLDGSMPQSTRTVSKDQELGEANGDLGEPTQDEVLLQPTRWKQIAQRHGS